MGVTGFWRHVVGRAGAKEDTDGTGSASQYLSDVAEWLGKAEGEKATVAVDVSLILYNAVKTLEAARQLDVVPKIPVTAALKHLQRCHDLLVKNGIVPVYVFDGARNPYKGDTNAAREAGRKAAVSAAAAAAATATGRHYYSSGPGHTASRRTEHPATI